VSAYAELGRSKTKARHQGLVVAAGAGVNHAPKRPHNQDISGGHHLRPRVHIAQDDHIAAMAHVLSGAQGLTNQEGIAVRSLAGGESIGAERPPLQHQGSGLLPERPRRFSTGSFVAEQQVV
jgi:hypothetical protein